jgi:hypothetical protein
MANRDTKHANASTIAAAAISTGDCRWLTCDFAIGLIVEQRPSMCPSMDTPDRLFVR